MLPKINRVLHADQVHAVLQLLFSNSPVKILRSIPATGLRRTSVPWVHWECSITGRRNATFISFQDLIEAFWEWMVSIKLLSLALWQRAAISRAVYTLFEDGDFVYHQHWGWCKLEQKELTEKKKLPRFWLTVDDRLIHCEPWQCVTF